MDKKIYPVKFNPEQALFEGAKKVFGENGGVNSSIHPSSTFTTMDPETMSQMFNGKVSEQGCYLYGRHFHPNAMNFGVQMAAMENTEIAYPVASGMAAISSVIKQIVQPNGHIIASSNIYGGTYAFLKNLAPRYGIDVTFLDDMTPENVEGALTDFTDLVFFEMHSNPSLKVVDALGISKIIEPMGIDIVVDNTFSPLIYSPANLGASVVIHSGTKFINGMSDGISGVICCDTALLSEMMDLNSGELMLSGPVLDARSCWQLQQYLQTLPVRMREHSFRTMKIAENLEAENKFKVIYPGLESHPSHELAILQANEGFGFGGLMAVDLETYENARKFVMQIQDSGWGLNAVSLGYYHSLLSISGSSTSSEIEPEVQALTQL
jgi:methionine-gamma-lyase